MKKDKKPSEEVYNVNRSLVLKLNKEDADYLKYFLYGRKDNRKALFDVMAIGKTTKVSMKIMLYLMAYILKFNTNEGVAIDISTFEEDKNDEPDYYLTMTLKEINV